MTIRRDDMNVFPYHCWLWSWFINIFLLWVFMVMMNYLILWVFMVMILILYHEFLCWWWMEGGPAHLWAGVVVGRTRSIRGPVRKGCLPGCFLSTSCYQLSCWKGLVVGWYVIQLMGIWQKKGPVDGEDSWLSCPLICYFST